MTNAYVPPTREEMGPVAARLGSDVPAAYVTLHAAWGEGLWVPEGEPIPPREVPGDDLLAYGTVLTPLVPFAVTGAGDRWCWAIEHRTARGEPEIWLCVHDEDRARVFAPDLAGWLYRCILEHRRDSDEPDDPAWSAVLERLESAYEVGVWALHVRGLDASPCPDPDAWIGEAFGSRYLKREPWQRGTSVPEDQAAIEAATRRMQDEHALLRFAAATEAADSAFREGRFADVVASLEPFADRLSPAQRVKLGLAVRRSAPLPER